MEDKVPDFWEDPMEQYAKDMTERARKLAKDYDKDHMDALCFSEVFGAHMQDAIDNEEMETPSKEELQEGQLLRLEAIGYSILKELRKLRE